MKDLSNVRLLAMDVDGCLTDGSMIYSPEGITKVFNAQDGLGLRLAMASGLEVVWITGNETPMVAKRAADLKISAVFQNARFKEAALRAVCEQCDVELNQVAYMGDDLNDLPAFRLAGVTFAPANAVHEIRQAADYVTKRSGGSGAVREMVETVLRAQGRWEQGVKAFLEALNAEQSESETSGVVA